MLIKILMIAGLAAGMAGCGIAREAGQESERSAADQRKAECDREFGAGKLKGFSARAQCYTSAEARLAAAYPEAADLLRVHQATRQVLAERVDRKQISPSEYELGIASSISRAKDSEDGRHAAAGAMTASATPSSQPYRFQPIGGSTPTVTCRTAHYGRFGSRTNCQ